MFDLGFIKDIRFLLRRMPIRTVRQTLLFSATLSHRVLELAYEHMNEPEKLVVERSEEHTSELQSLMRISYAVFCLKKKKKSNALNYNRSSHTNRVNH